jgi:hypothetical protein
MRKHSFPLLSSLRAPLLGAIVCAFSFVCLEDGFAQRPGQQATGREVAHKDSSGKDQSDTAQQPQTSNAKGLAFLHTPPRPDDLPYPGQPMTITAAITNTKETKLPVRVAMVRDGKFVEVPAREAYLDKFDRPIYEIPTIAPVGEMIYQLILVQTDGSVVNSPRFAVRRTCTPQVDLSEGNVPTDIQGVERLRKLVIESKGLENDLNGYNQVLKTLGELKGVVGE